MLCLLVFFSVFLYSSGYYQQPEVVQFTRVPHDAVVCQGCRLDIQCSIELQNSSAGKQHVPHPELEWIFNGSKVLQTQTTDNATHCTAKLIINNAQSNHSGIYQCRAKDGNHTSNCRSPSINCVPTTTISRPAKILVVGESSSNEFVSSGCGVVVLACGGRLLGGAVMETPTLTWKRNGEELTSSSEDEVLLSNGDLAINASTHGTPHYECVASFNTADGGLRNVTLAVYNMASPYGEGSGIGSGSDDLLEVNVSSQLRLISSTETVAEGGSVELVCEALLRDEKGRSCVAYHVTWSRGSLDGGDRDMLLTDKNTTLDMNGHLLRINQVSNTSQYCCQVQTDDTMLEECTTIHVLSSTHKSVVNASTVFLGGRGGPDVIEIECSPPPTSPSHVLTWYHNGAVIEGFTNSSLTVEYNIENSSDVFGVYQCFSAVGTHSVEEIAITRVLCYGLTNPPSAPTLREVPYPSPNDYTHTGAFEVSWKPPQLKGGLSTLNYNTTINFVFFFDYDVITSDTNSVVAYIEDNEDIFVTVTVVGIDYESDVSFSRQLSETGPQYTNQRLQSECAGKALYPPMPDLDCSKGLVNLSWIRVANNRDLFIDGTEPLEEEEYVVGNCTHPNGSVDRRYNYTEVPTSPHRLYNNVRVGTHCQFAMVSTKMEPQNCGSKCFCYKPSHVNHSRTTECYVQGSVEFVYGTLEAFENDSSVEVCVRAYGYGFAVNISTQSGPDGYTLTTTRKHQLYFDQYNDSLNKTLCINISILDDNIVEDIQNFTVVLSTDNDLVRLGDPSVVHVIVKDNDYPTVNSIVITSTLDNDEQNNDAQHAVILICVMLAVVLFIVVVVAGSVYCHLRWRRVRKYQISQNKIESIDWSKDPAVLISSDNPYFHTHQFTEDNFDCKSLLDYLGPTTNNNKLNTKQPHQILSTGQGLVDRDSPQLYEDKMEPVHTKQEMNCYNASVESGVILDSDDIDAGINNRKLSNGSMNLSQSLSHDMVHSYVGMGNDDVFTCTCTECRQHRERVYSKNRVCETQGQAVQQRNCLLTVRDLDPVVRHHDEPYCHVSNKDDKESFSESETVPTNIDKQADKSTCIAEGTKFNVVAVHSEH